MSLSNSQLRRLNRRFGETFGFNPFGQPVFRFVRTSDIFRHVLVSSDFEVADGCKIYRPVKKYVDQPWSVHYGEGWILTKWRGYTPDEWFNQTQGLLPYPSQGEWEPVENIRLGPQFPALPPEPNYDMVTRAIWCIVRHRDRVAAKHVDKPEEDTRLRESLETESKEFHDKAVASKMGELDDILKDAMTPWGKKTGSHDGATEFMSGKQGE